ncbi:Retrovirus-related Pol polyprotein from transposon opus [Ceratobasidium sp. AG-Ba]|nr:Retrovirus-related Pol polyprotein from transposon opus [Ceratobasidium sp. AG-Ba]
MYESRPDDNTGPGAYETVDPGWESANGIINDVSHLVKDQGTAQLLRRFANDPFFADILLHLVFDLAEDSTALTADEIQARKKRAHRAEEYLIEDGKLWLVRGRGMKGDSKVECIPASEAKALALAVHSAGGHFGRDMTILTLQLRYFWPELRRDVVETVTSCPRCKNFGPQLLSAHMQPITRARPFDLLVGDYVSLPTGHGGFKTVLVLVDVYSRFMFTFPLKGPGTGKFTVDALSKISDEVREWATTQGVQPLTTPPYAPWTNGLAEGSIKLLIGRLKALCTATVGESPEEDSDPTSTPSAWPKHLAHATAQLNDRVLPSLRYTPRELLTGQPRAEHRIQLSHPSSEPTQHEVDVNMALTYALRQDAYALALEHANKRKRAFDKHVRAIEFHPGDLVQRYNARWDETHSSTRKLVPRWSGPLRIVSRSLNSYALEDLHGQPFASAAHARLLRPFIPRPGSALAAYSDSLKRARQLNPRATQPIAPQPALALPSTPRPETKFPLDREDATQPNKYQIQRTS